MKKQKDMKILVSRFLEEVKQIDPELKEMILDLADRHNESHLDQIKAGLFKLSERIRLETDIMTTKELIEMIMNETSRLRLQYNALMAYYPSEQTFQFKNLKNNRGIGRSFIGKLSILKNFYNFSAGIKQGYYILGAVPNVGKSAYLTTLAIDIILSDNEKTDILYFSLDDSIQVTMQRFTSCLSAAINLLDKTYRNKNFFINQSSYDYRINDPLTFKLREFCIDYLDKCVETGRLKIYDANLIQGAIDIENIIAENQKEDRDLIVFVDAVRRLKVTGLKTETEREEFRANKMKEFSVMFGIPVITSHEVLKDPNRKRHLNMDDLKGSGNYAYNADFVALMDYNDKKKFIAGVDRTINFFVDKNKVSSGRGLTTLNAMPACSFFSEVYNEY